MLWLFWVLAALMSAVAAALVLWPLWRRSGAGTSRRDENIAIYRERVAELRAEVAAGRVPEDEAQSLEAELGRRLLSEAGETPEAEPTGGKPRRPWLVSGALAALVPAVAFGIYLVGGDWRLIGGDRPPLPHLVERLEERVQEDPKDSRAWMHLARAREGLEQYDAAAEAYARVNALTERPHADMLVQEGQARAMARDGDIRGRPIELFEQALEQNPNNGRALWYVGMAAAQSGDTARARRLWQRLSQQELPQAFRDVLEQRLAALPQETR